MKFRRFGSIGGLILLALAALVWFGTGSLGIALALLLVFGIPLVLAQEVPAYTSTGGRVWNYAYTLICTLVFLFLIAPILVVIPLSFNAEPYFTFTDRMLAFDPAGYSLRWYEQLLTFGMQAPNRVEGWWADVWANAAWVRAAKNSIIIGFFSTLLATSLGTLAALGLARPEMPYRRLIMAILISPMIVPLIIVATGLFFFYSRVGLANSYIGIVLAHATLGIPFVIITVTATLVGFDQSLIRASRSLGANEWTTFRQVVLAAHHAGRHLRRAVRLRHLVRRGGRGLVRCELRAADHTAADVERHSRADQPDHPVGRDDPGAVLHRVADDGGAAAAAQRATAGAFTRLGPMRPCRRPPRTLAPVRPLPTHSCRA